MHPHKIAVPALHLHQQYAGPVLLGLGDCRRSKRGREKIVNYLAVLAKLNWRMRLFRTGAADDRYGYNCQYTLIDILCAYVAYVNRVH